MDTEIELKLLIDKPVDIEQLLSRISTIHQQQSQQLYNAYYDTHYGDLRGLDIGLRIRRADDTQEQTIKTKGKVVGGLHHRPEYNLPVTGEFPELDKFPAAIWPPGTDVAALQAQLHKVFSTDFTRNQFLLQYKRTQMELVIDLGEVKAGTLKEPINEIELELKSGHVSELFDFAHQLVVHLPCRMGTLSKAARGYRLATDKPLVQPERIGIINVAGAKSVGEAALEALERGFYFWQKQEDAFCLSGDIRDLWAMYKGMKFVCHCLKLYQGRLNFNDTALLIKLIDDLHYVDESAAVKELVSKKGVFRKKLEDMPKLIRELKTEAQQIDAEEKALAVIWSEQYASIKLHLSEFIYRLHQAEPEEGKAALRKFAVAQQQQSLDSVMQAGYQQQSFSLDDYLAFEEKLRNALRTGLCLAGLFDEQQTALYRAPWLDILHGIDELKLINFLKTKLKEFELVDVQSLENWCNKKLQRTIEVMEQTRTTALKATPYW